ncbi:MAG: hypothetical protein IKW28_08225 [Lachnospiraceae bacterium]|nr:hypothetical protein [Lachnospiraceae bacterium]
MKASVIHHSLDLLVRLIDTTNGYPIGERDVHFYEDEKELFPRARGVGNYVFINYERKNRRIMVKTYGYEPITVDINYENMDSVVPVREIFLIPSENLSRGGPVISFTGTLSGISEIEAVSLEPSGCTINSYDERKRLIKMFKTRQTNLENLYYGLINMEKMNYEKFVVEKEMPDCILKIREPLKEGFSINSPIARIVFGMVDERGNYCLRIRDDRENLKYIIRYVVSGKENFREIDFRKPEETILE